jgi:DNA polymerase-3 subunit gamma/tau
MTLYLKYRPQKLKELDSKNVRETLEKIVESGKIPHAFLFAGPKGTGKTSAARILAKVVNCVRNQPAKGRGRAKKKLSEPCNKCDQCKTIARGSNIDVIELDAASHRGIDDVRTLRDAVKLAPAKAEKKVYIIDEAHMLTTEASNALLKTLEEPPEHVMFILATTNPEKLIETIRSRTTNIAFGKARPDEIVRSLKRVIKGEKLKANKDAVEAIASAADGSYRDAIKILEQLVAEKKKLTKEEIEEFLYKKRSLDIANLLKFLSEKNTKSALAEVERVVGSGVSVGIYVEALLTRLRQALLEKVGMDEEGLDIFDKSELVALIRLFNQTTTELRDACIEQLPLELAIVEWCQTEAAQALDNGGQSEGKKEAEEETAREAEVAKESTTRKIVLAEPVAKTGTKKLKKVTDEIWKRILTQIRPLNHSTEALLRAARPLGYDGRTLRLGVFYRFHKERLEGSQHRRILEEVITSILGSPVKVVCTLTESPAKRTQRKPEIVSDESKVVLAEGEDEDIVKVAKEIFGS